MLSISWSVIIFACLVFKANAKIFVDYTTKTGGEPLIDEWRFENMQADYFSSFQALQAAHNELNENLLFTERKLSATLNTLNTTLKDIKKYVSGNAPKVISSCSEAKLPVNGENNAVFYIKLPNSDVPEFAVLCMKGPYGGAPWTVLQRRQDGSVDFYRNWESYENGFGSLYGDFWLGLEKIHQLTKSAKHELWIKFDQFDGKEHYARYDAFVVENKNTKYKISNIGSYFGDTKDSFSQQLNEAFTTKDNDNDKLNNENCAVTYTGAWWFGKCYFSHLNGRYLRNLNGNDDKERGIIWYEFSPSESMKYVHMAIRPRK